MRWCATRNASIPANFLAASLDPCTYIIVIAISVMSSFLARCGLHGVMISSPPNSLLDQNEEQDRVQITK